MYNYNYKYINMYMYRCMAKHMLAYATTGPIIILTQLYQYITLFVELDDLNIFLNLCTFQVYKECRSKADLSARLKIQASRGPIAGILYCICYAISYLILLVTSYLQVCFTFTFTFQLYK